MAEASIPVDLLNPGQVFACLGFLEAGDVLLGDAEGGFDWGDEAHVRFVLRGPGAENPFAVVLNFLAEAKIRRWAPVGYTEPPPKRKAPPGNDGDDDPTAADDVPRSESFPAREGDPMALPIRLEVCGRPPIDLGHWADGSRRRNDFKLYAGNRSAYGIARAMLRGTRKKPTKKQSVGDIKTQGVEGLWGLQREELTARPFDVLTLMHGRFNFDARGSWTALGAGYSPDEQGHGIAASPVVEMLAAWGLEHARPVEYETRKVRYGAWGGLVPPILARPVLSCANVALPVRRFRFVLELPGRNKVITFAQEEIHA
jgi:CRISPR-associated protein Csx14